MHEVAHLFICLLFLPLKVAPISSKISVFSWHLWPELFCFGEVSEHQPRENWTLSYSRIWAHLHLSVDQRWFSRNQVISFIITIVLSLCTYFQSERQIVGEWQREDGEEWKKTVGPCYRQAAVAPVKGHSKNPFLKEGWLLAMGNEEA